MKIVAIIQARLNSVRFPNKVITKINSKTLIEILSKRINKSKKIDDLVVVIPNTKKNDALNYLLKSKKIKVFRGDEKNVLKRFYYAAKKHKADVVLRICGDCPLIDGSLIDSMVDSFFKNNLNYLTNNEPPSYPDGFDLEIFDIKTLEKTYKNARSEHDKEHVTPFIKKDLKLKKMNFKSNTNLSNVRLTVDDYEDLIVIKEVFKYFDGNNYFKWKDIQKLILKKKFMFKKGIKKERDLGSKISTGIKYWERAKKVIPGGNMLFSKKPEIFSPQSWPTYFSKAKKCFVWDLEGKKYQDLSLMGVGTNILGYCNSKVDKAVIEVVNKGNMSTLNCFEEVLLSERLVDINPWSSMVKYARTGGEANLIALRIARACSGKDKIAFCGYHGWHDWYLASNIKNEKNLRTHLMTGLNTAGVPNNLKNDVISFNYNDFEKAAYVLNKKGVGALIMEVSRNIKPQKNFLENIRKITKKKGIVLIFDECSSGFRETFGGLHKKFKVNPDIAIYGKALGNGYPITAVVGTEEVMSYAKNSFISSTFWSDRIGPTAALKTLELMEKIKSWEIITQIGKDIKSGWLKLAKKHGLKIIVQGLDAMPNYSIKSPNWLKYKTYIIQEMLKKNYLASNTVYCCIDHEQKILKRYFFNLDKIFKTISECEDGLNVDNLIEGKIIQDGFKRLN